jgi:hypothetical protein
MFCVNCGTKIEEGVKFCSGCGTPVVSAGVEIKQEKAVNFIQTQPSALPASGVYQAQNTQITASGTTDKKGFAIASLVLGLCSLLAFLLPFLGFPVSIVGLIMGVVGYKSSKKGFAIAGLILSMIGLVATIINSAIGAYQGATGQLFY